VIHPLTEAHTSEDLSTSTEVLLLFGPPDKRCQVDVLQRREFADERVILKNVARPVQPEEGSLVIGECEDIGPVDRDTPRRRPIEETEGMQERRLTDPDELAPGDLKRDTRKGADLPPGALPGSGAGIPDHPVSFQNMTPGKPDVICNVANEAMSDPDGETWQELPRRGDRDKK